MPRVRSLVLFTCQRQTNDVSSCVRVFDILTQHLVNVHRDMNSYRAHLVSILTTEINRSRPQVRRSTQTDIEA